MLCVFLEFFFRPRPNNDSPIGNAYSNSLTAHGHAESFVTEHHHRQKHKGRCRRGSTFDVPKVPPVPLHTDPCKSIRPKSHYRTLSCIWGYKQGCSQWGPLRRTRIAEASAMAGVWRCSGMAGYADFLWSTAAFVQKVRGGPSDSSTQVAVAAARGVSC